MTPVRIQRKRIKGWKMPDNTVYVGRGSPWGNPYEVWQDHDGQWYVSLNRGNHQAVSDKAAGIDIAVASYEKYVSVVGRQHHHGMHRAPHPTDIIKHLRGKHLACWCAPGKPCHADVLLRIANSHLQKETAT